MKKLNIDIKGVVKQFFIISVAIAIIGVAINMFLGPHHIAAGGVSGLGILAEHAFSIDRSIVVLILNIVMLVLAYVFLGKKVFGNMLLGSALVPIFLAIIPNYMLVDDRMTSILFGSAIFGLGVAILYRNNASSGGTTIPPLIAKKYFGLNTATGLLITDSIVVFFNIIVFGKESFFSAILSLVVTMMVMSYIETGMSRKRVMLINSKKNLTAIQDAAISEGHRKVRIFETRDAYRKIDEGTLMLVVDNSEYPTMVKRIDEIDEKALIVTYNVAEMHGLEALREEAKEILVA